MFRYKVLTVAFALLFQTTLGSLCERQNNLEDVNEIAKQVEKKFRYVKRSENFTAYLVNGNVSLSFPVVNSNPPDHWDWRDKGMVSPIKDQKRCAACWAFSTAACIESQLALQKGIHVSLSEQFLIDCVRYGKDDAPKCGHYSLIKAYSVIVTDFGGVLQTSDYRPFAGSAGVCTYTKPPPTPQPVSGFMRVPSNEDTMVKALYQQGPLSAAINAKSMEKYNRNNYIDEPTEEQCPSSPENMDHAVLIVGYNIFVGNGRKVPYWIIKNSWGKEWGDNGFYYLVRGRNACGISNDVSFAIV